MSQPIKNCPRCQAPAPLETAFCEQCGHRYRTAFPAQNPPPRPATSAKQPAPPLLRAAILVVAVCVAYASFVLVLRLGRDKPANFAADPVRLQPQPTHTGSAPPTNAVEERKAEPIDPVEAEARRALNRAKRDLDIPQNAATDETGRLRLRGGGAIDRATWEEAQRKLQNSPVLQNQNGTR
jgi:hypothetical protein